MNNKIYKAVIRTLLNLALHREQHSAVIHGKKILGLVH